MADVNFSGVSERKYVLVDVLQKNFTDKGTSEVSKYYEIWVKVIQDNRIIKFKPFDTKTFGEKFENYKTLIGKDVLLKIEAKEFNSSLYATVSDILPVL